MKAPGMTGFTVKTETSPATLLLGPQFVSLSFSGSALNGVGGLIGFEYGLSEHWSVRTELSLAIATNGGSFLYTGLEANVHYSLLGTPIRKCQTLAHEGRTIISECTKSGNRLSVGLGPVQLILNGSSAVYPATGFAGELSYAFSPFSSRVEVSAKYETLTANRAPGSALVLGLTFPLGL